MWRTYQRAERGIRSSLHTSDFWSGGISCWCNSGERGCSGWHHLAARSGARNQGRGSVQV